MVIIYGNINQWVEFEDNFIGAVSVVLNEFCNDNFDMCCPDVGSKTQYRQTLYTFVNETHVDVAMGYPELDNEDDSFYWVMLVVRPPPDNDLYQAGPGRNDSLLLEQLIRDVGSGVYLDQDVLYEAIEGLYRIEIMTGINIGEVERGAVIEKDIVIDDEDDDVGSVFAIILDLLLVEVLILVAVLAFFSVIILVTYIVVCVKK
ncbi:uncharacterized protein LOC144356543 [Saccoglossus kowalevskii]